MPFCLRRKAFIFSNKESFPVKPYIYELGKKVGD